MNPKITSLPRALWRKARPVAIVLIALAMVLPATTTATSETGRSGPGAPAGDPPDPVLQVIDSITTTVNVPPGGQRVLWVDSTNNSLVPLDWDDPLEGVTGVHAEAVDAVEPWLKRDLATQLLRMGSNGDRFARLIRDCPEDLWVDEIAFSVAHTPIEELRTVSNENVLRDNVQQLYAQDQFIAYADLVERTGEDGNYTTVQYINYTGVQHEYPRDIYYWYVAHARVFWEAPAKVSGKSFWRKAYFEEITWEDSGTLKSHLQGASNIIEAANVSTIWMQMNMEFGYGTNPLQPVQVLLERYGSCGQYSITGAATLKVAMIPARVGIYSASDHQWCEVWIDGHWMHVDPSNDVAGNSRVKEPELIRRTNNVNFNDAGLFERGWKPYMSAMSTFRSDDVIINSIDISAPNPAFSFKEAGMVERNVTSPHVYTETSTVHINVHDSNGDPIEGAWVGVFRVGHNIYDPGTSDYPHFAYANYTDHLGQADFELGLQGYCSRCDADHYYAALILSQYNSGTNDFYAFGVPEENTEYTFSYTVTGNAPMQVEPQWSQIVDTMPLKDYRLAIDLEAWGLQRHNHGEYGQYEVFGFRTSFDHLFPADVDVLVTNATGLDDYLAGNTAACWSGATNTDGLDTTTTLPHWEDSYLILSNTDCSESYKVVNLTVNLSAPCVPRLALSDPVDGVYHNTDEPLLVNGTLWDYVAITELEVSTDGGITWTDIMGNYSVEDGTYTLVLDTTSFASDERTIIISAMDEAGIWRQVEATVVMDAEDPSLSVLEPSDGAILPAGEDIGVDLTVGDNNELRIVEVRLAGRSWVEAEPALVPPGVFNALVPSEDEVGETYLEVRAVDIVGRTTLVTVDIVLDAMNPILELRTPDPDSETVVGADEDVTVKGSIWDDHGLAVLELQVDEGPWMDLWYTLDEGGRFELDLPTSEWEEGEHQVVVRVTDMAGHTHQRGFSIVRDASPPEIVLGGFDDVYDDDDDVSLSATITDDHGVAEVWISVDGGYEELIYLDLTGGFVYPLPSGAKAVGTHDVTLRTVDELGNERTMDIAYEVVDETDPQLFIDVPVSGSKHGRGKALSMTGTCSDNVGIATLTLQIGPGEPQDILGSLDPVTDQIRHPLATAGMELGDIVLKVTVADTSGNQVTRTIMLTLEDRTDPELELELGLTVPKVTKGKELVLPATFSDDVGVAKVEYRVDGFAWIEVLIPISGQTTDVTVPTGPLTTGDHILEVRVTDDAGNSVVQTTPFSIAPPPEDSAPSGVVIGGIAVALIIAVVLALMIMNRSKAAEAPVEDEGAAPGKEAPVSGEEGAPTEEAGADLDEVVGDESA